MESKLKAVRKAVNAGIETCIANGREPERLSDILTGSGICTRFKPNAKAKAAREKLLKRDEDAAETI